MADNFNATFANGQRFAAEELSGIKHLRVTGPAADDAAAAGSPVSIGGVYQSTVDEVDANDVGRVRMTARRGLVTAHDSRSITGSWSAVNSVGDLEISTTTNLYGPYTAVSATSHLSGSVGGALYNHTNPVHYRLSMLGYSAVSIAIYQSLAVNVSVRAYAMVAPVGGATIGIVPLHDAITLASSASLSLFPYAYADTAPVSYKFVPGLQMPMDYIMFTITPAAAASSGGIWISAVRR